MAPTNTETGRGSSAVSRRIRTGKRGDLPILALDGKDGTSSESEARLRLRLGSKPRNAATTETTGYARAFRRRFYVPVTILRRGTQSAAIKRRSRCGLLTGVSRGEFALLSRPYATSRAMNSLYLFESWFLGLHVCQLCGNPHDKNGRFCPSFRREHFQDALHCPVLITPYLHRPVVIAFMPVEVFIAQNLTK